MHQADSLLNRLETEDDWIDRPLGPQRVVDRHCPRDRRRPDFGEVERIKVNVKPRHPAGALTRSAALRLFRTGVAGFVATL
jgi:hypothetical protein